MTSTKPGAIPKSAVFAFIAALAIFLIYIYGTDAEHPASSIAGYSLGFFAAALHYLQVLYFSKLGNNRFFSLYGSASLLRLSFVLILFVSLLILEKIDQFSFTVSFLISYICHSVIDIYLIKDD